MWNSHVTNLLSAYCHNELSTEKTAQVKAHLGSCERCQHDLAQIKLGISFARQLSTKAAPTSLWPAIAENLVAEKTSLSKWLTWQFATASLVLIAVAFASWHLYSRQKNVEVVQQKIPVQKAERWEITKLAGAPKIGGTEISNTEKIGVGEWLETDQSSRARLKIADIGFANIDPNSRVKLVKTETTEHRIELAKGKLSALVLAPPRLFVVDTPSATAVDLGCAYTLEVDEAGNSILHVTSGWVSFVLRGNESFIPAGATCVTKKDVGVGTPYYADAAPAFIDLLAKIDFDPYTALPESVPTLLAQAREKDGLTLWHLLQRREWDESLRSAVFERLAKLHAPPKGVTRTGILQQDRQMLDQWWQDWMY